MNAETVVTPIDPRHDLRLPHGLFLFVQVKRCNSVFIAREMY